MVASSMRVKGGLKADTIFDLTFDTRQKCSKFTFLSRESFKFFKDINSQKLFGISGSEFHR